MNIICISPQSQTVHFDLPAGTIAGVTQRCSFVSFLTNFSVLSGGVVAGRTATASPPPKGASINDVTQIFHIFVPPPPYHLSVLFVTHWVTPSPSQCMTSFRYGHRREQLPPPSKTPHHNRLSARARSCNHCRSCSTLTYANALTR